MVMFVFLVVIVPVMLGCFFSPGAAWRWVAGLILGVCCYGAFIGMLEGQGRNFYAGVEGAIGFVTVGSILGGITLLSLFLNQQDDHVAIGVLCLLVASFFLFLYALELHNGLTDIHAIPALRLHNALVNSGPGLMWTELLLLRAVWLIREGKGCHVNP